MQSTSNYIQIPGGTVKRNYKLSDVAEIYLSEEGPSSAKPITFIDAFKRIRKIPGVRDYKAFAWEENYDNEKTKRNKWESWTYEEFLNEAESIGSALVKIGTKKFEGAAIWGFNSQQWAAAMVGGIMSGVVGLGIYPTDSEENIAYKVLHTNSRVIFVDNASKQEKLLKLHQEGKFKFPDGSQKLKAVVAWGKDAKKLDGGDLEFYSWDEFKQLGDNESMAEVKARQDTIQPGNCCCLIYTSGTTGQPKACMISHDAAIWISCNAICKENFPSLPRENRVLSYLPLSHIFGLLVDILAPIACASEKPHDYLCTTYFSRPTDLKKGTIGLRIQSVQPTIFAGVPRVWEKFMAKLKAKARTGVVGSIIGKAKEILKANGIAAQVGGDNSVRWGTVLAEAFAHMVKKKIGLDQCALCVSGAAPMSREVAEYLASIGLNIKEGYGMSETCACATVNQENYFKWGTIGKELNGVEVKVFNEKGEVCEKYDDTDLENGEIPEKFQGEIR